MIRTLQVSGYRLLDDFEADFGQLTVVIGANATGKSTLLDCLQFIARCAEHPLDDALGWSGGFDSLANAAAQSDKIGWQLTFAKPSLTPLWSQLPLPDDRVYTYEVTLARDPSGQAMPVYEILRTAEGLGDHSQPLKFLEATPRFSKIFDPRQRRFVDFDTAVPELAHAATNDRMVPASSEDAVRAIVAPPEKTALRLSQMRFFNEYPEPSWIRSILSNWAFYPGFEVGRFSDVRMKPAEIKATTLLSVTGDNLGTVLHEILTRHDYHDSAEDLRGFLRSAYASFEQINAETAFGAPGKLLVKLREAGMQRAMELWDLSDGMLRFLCLAAALLNPAPPPFVAVDEPEAGLHPSLLPIVADMIKTASERTQVLVSTQSPDLLSCFDLDDIAVMTRDEARAIWRRPRTRATLRKMLESVSGETLGDLHRSGELEAYE